MRRIFLAMFFILMSMFIYGEEIREIAEEIKCIRTLEGHSSIVSSIIYSPDGKYIVSGSGDEIKIWEVSSGECIKTLEGHSSVNSISYSYDGKYIASGSYDKTIKIWEVSSGKCIKTLEGHSAYVNSISYSYDGKYIASSGYDNSIKIWEISSGKCIRTLKGHSSSVDSVIYSPDGKYIASGGLDKTIRIWEVSSGECIKTLEGHSYVNSISYSPDGKYLSSGSDDEKIKIWEVSSGKCIKTLEGHSSYINSVSYSPDGKYIVSGSSDRTVKIWEVGSGKCIRTLEGHEIRVKSISYSPDGKYLASGSLDKTIKIWEVSGGKCIKTLEGHTDSVNCISDSSNGKYIASGSNDGTIKIWKNQKFGEKIRITEQLDINDEEMNIIGSIPANTICLADKEEGRILKPIKGYIDSSKVEELDVISDNKKLYLKKSTSVFIDAELTKPIYTFNAGKIFDTAYYSDELDKYYIEEKSVKGWLNSEDVQEISKDIKTVAILKNNTKSYTYINGNIKNSYNSGEILRMEWKNSEGYLYSDSTGWISQNELEVIDSSNSGKRIFVASDNSLFQADFTGENYKTVKIGSEYEVLGETTGYYLLKNKNTLEKGLMKKEYLSYTKPDLNDPVIILTETVVDENSMLHIKGKIYDDTEITSFMLNGRKMITKNLDKFDNISYKPEVGYSFDSQWYLIEGTENSVEIKVTDREGKSYSKVLKYTPELKGVNLDDFKLSNAVKKLPKLEYGISMKDEDGDGILTGGEKISLTITIKNIGEGDAQNVIAKIKNSDRKDIMYKSEYSMNTVKSGEIKVVVIEFKGDEKITAGKAKFELAIEEQNGFNPYPANFTFNTEPKSEPKLEIVDYAIDDENKNGKIEQNEKFDLYILVQNKGEGDAKNVIFETAGNADGIIATSDNSFKYPVLKSGESRKEKVSFITTYKYKGDGTLPFNLKMQEERAKYFATKDIKLAMNKIVPTIKEVNLEAKKSNKKVEEAEKLSIMSDVDEFINSAEEKPKDENKWAVVIGVENYRKTVPVEFAGRDAQVAKLYFTKLMGVPEKNVFSIINEEATTAEIRVLIENTLKNRAKKGSTVYVYFSGHGIPTNEGETYLMLHDSDPQNPKLTAYSVTDLYSNLGKLESSKVYVMLDSCFAGGSGRTDGVKSLLEGTRPGVLKVNDVALQYDNLKIFTATDKNQLSNSYKEKGHGLFTYYLLKEMQKDGNIENIKESIIRDVEEKSREMYGETRYQRPVFRSR